MTDPARELLNEAELKELRHELKLIQDSEDARLVIVETQLTAAKEVAHDLADVLVHMVVGWEETLGVDLAKHPEVIRVMRRYREFKEQVTE